MEFDLPRAAGLLLAFVGVSVAALIGAPMMGTSTILMMVLPSMLVFAGIAFAIGVKHGEYRASQ